MRHTEDKSNDQFQKFLCVLQRFALLNFEDLLISVEAPYQIINVIGKLEAVEVNQGNYIHIYELLGPVRKCTF